MGRFMLYPANGIGANLIDIRANPAAFCAGTTTVTTMCGRGMKTCCMKRWCIKVLCLERETPQTPPLDAGFKQPLCSHRWNKLVALVQNLAALIRDVTATTLASLRSPSAPPDSPHALETPERGEEEGLPLWHAQQHVGG
jgi:hypothetical protein